MAKAQGFLGEPLHNASVSRLPLQQTRRGVCIEHFPGRALVQRQMALCVCLTVGLAVLSHQNAWAQSSLTNGVAQQGGISAGAEVDSWTFDVNAGDQVTLQVAKLTGGAAFVPRIELFTPSGASLGISSGSVAARLDARAAVGGTYTAQVRDTQQTGTGTYQLQVAQVPGSFVVAAGDEGGALTNAVNHMGTIAVGDLDLWSFTANADERIVLQVAKLSGGAAFSPVLELFAPDGARVGVDSGGVAARVDAQAASTGTYTVLISALSPDATGSYQLQLAKVPGTFTTPAGDEGGALADAVDQDGTITVGDLDLWTFTGNPGDRITLQITELTGGANFTPKLELMGPNGDREAFAQNAATATDEIAIEVAGTYTALVSDASETGTGTYRLRLTRGSIGAPGANVLVNGATSLGEIATAFDTNFWTFTASAGDRIVVRIGEINTTAFAPWIRLMNPNGTQQISASSAVAAEIAVTATNTGTFTVVVSDGSNGRNLTGGYRLTLAKPGSPNVVVANDEGGLMTNGLMHTGTIDVGDLDVWHFTANAGETIAVRMGELSSGSTLTPYLRLYGPEGVLLSGYGASAVASEVSVRATNSGTFTVVATDSSNGNGGSGGYRLKLAKTGSPIVVLANDEGGPLTNGVMHTGSVDVGDVDVWSFTANAGESIVVRMGDLTAASLDPYLRLFGPNGALLDTYGSGSLASEVTFRATNSGTFTVLATDLSNAYGGSGTYRLKLAKTGSPIVVLATDEGGAMTNGLMHTGSIEVGDVDVWNFSAEAGESIVVRMGDLTTASLDPYLRLFGPNGALLSTYGAGTIASEVSFRATNSGIFTVVATDLSNAYGGSGTYRLKLGKTGSPIVVLPDDEGGPMTNGITHTGMVDPGDLDVWSFTANAGDNIVVRMGELTTASLTPYLRLFGPNGALLDVFGASSVASEVAFRATNSGTFTVVATDLSNAYGGSGAYRLQLGKTGSPIVVLADDDGGEMTNGVMHTGAIELGDLDVWNFTATAGDTIIVRMGELATASLTPYLRLFGPNGALLDTFGASSVASEVLFRATNSGTFTVVATDLSNAYGGSGAYQVTLAKTGSPIFVAAGDEGGEMFGLTTYDGSLGLGDVDAWTFTACEGDLISVTASELVSGSSFTPWLRLFGRDGTLLRSISGAAVAQVSLVAPAAGSYTVMLGDFSNAYGGAGTYQLAVNGLTHEMRLCDPAGTNLNVTGIGGMAGTPLVLLTTTNLSTPAALWDPIQTNQFSQFGVYAYTNQFDPAEPERYFRLLAQ